jgi:tetratricopeptide (TPR) repeat protein
MKFLATLQGHIEVFSEIFCKFAPKYAIMEMLSWEDIKQKFNTDKRFKLYTYIGGGIIALLVLYLGYRQLIWSPADEKANDGWWTALNYVEKDSTDQAIKVLVPFVKKYDGHVGGEIGQYLLGTQYMKKGQFQKAMNELEDVSVSDTYMSVMTVGLQGDCLSELKKYEQAATKYAEAAEMLDNEFTAPMYLFKAGLHAELSKNFEDASAYFTRIRDDYPDYGNQKTIDKYIARVSTVKGK